MTVTSSLPEASRPDTRETRALELFRAHGRRIERLDRDLYLVPSQDGLRTYRVEYGDGESCSCPDHDHRGVSCVHLYALGVHFAKRRGTTARRLATLEDRYEHQDLDLEERLELLAEIRTLRRRVRA